MNPHDPRPNLIVDADAASHSGLHLGSVNFSTVGRLLSEALLPLAGALLDDP